MEITTRRGTAFLGALLALPFFPAAARAVIPFTEESRVIFSSFTVQDVQPDGANYRMYLTSNSFVVMSATSTNQETWGLESGIRLSTGASGVDASSITSCAVVQITTNPADGQRMYYVGIAAGGAYSVLSATSTDGLTWSKESGVRIQRNGGLAFLATPRPLVVSPTVTKLFYVADNAGGNTPSNYRIFAASSTDQGTTFTDLGAVLSSEQAFQVSVTTLTDGRTRLYYSAPSVAGSTTPARVLSAISTNATSFTAESGVRLSTSPAELVHPVVVRSTQSFRWRMFQNYTAPSSTVTYISSAWTIHPLTLTLTPTTVLKSQSNVSFTATGEIFGSGPGVTFYIGGDTITASGVTATNDLSITGTLDPLGRATGRRNMVVTNADGSNGTLVNALLVDIAAGSLNLVDNLIRPRLSQSTTINLQIFEAGRVTVKVFTVSGGLVATLADHAFPEGNISLTWDGRTSAGNVVASGVYLLHASGPKLKETKKIVVIK